MTSPTTSTPAFVLPQTGIFAQGTSAHHFLEFDLHAHTGPAEAVSAFRGLRAPDVASGGVNLVLAFSGQTCPRDALGARPGRVRSPAGRRTGRRHRPDEAGQRRTECT